MTKTVIEPAVISGKPKRLLDQIRDVRKTLALFQASKANVVEALVPSAYFPGSVLDTNTATARLLANIGH